MKRGSIVKVTLETVATITKRDDDTTTTAALPTMDMPTLADPNAYTTPSVSVPPNNDNPFIIRQHNPSGTVFIAVGAIVGSILLGFILYHLILSLSASRLAKRTSDHDKTLYEKYQSNNNNAYGFANVTPTSTFNHFTNEYPGHTTAPSISKLPLLSRPGANFGTSQSGDGSTIYQSDIAAGATSKHDLTKMFISPTAEVMQQKRFKSQYNASLTNLPFGSSATNLVNPSPATNRHSQLVPNLYISGEGNNSDYSLAQSQGPPHPRSHQLTPEQNDVRQQLERTNPRQTVPSMYLEDLFEKR
ncbi:uncharacterized protein LODBEIA_P01540 [Lodderomyces beijingensis]|uniref:Vacuolar membrane protein n=1 Tax=Lodderomyces beijingensis TaxID=1775926 RepID=A0ABP0ZFH8_9ASCO